MVPLTTYTTAKGFAFALCSACMCSFGASLGHSLVELTDTNMLTCFTVIQIVLTHGCDDRLLFVPEAIADNTR